jgi:hypothetical protein
MSVFHLQEIKWMKAVNKAADVLDGAALICHSGGIAEHTQL